MRRAAAILACLIAAGMVMAHAAPQKRATKAAAAKAGQVQPTQAAKRAVPVPAKNAARASNVARTPRVVAAKKAAGPRQAKPINPARGRIPAPGKPPARPDPELIAAYAAMPVGDRRTLQSDLIWTGDYNGVINDDFGERAIAAVKSYQTRTGAEPSGLLTAAQRTALAAAAKTRQQSSGWRVVDDAATGARLAVPIKHAPQSSATNTGTRWSSIRGEVQIDTFRIGDPGTTLAAVFAQQKKDPANRQVEYSLLRDNFFVLSGQQGLKRFYVRAQAQDNEVRGFIIMYDQAMQGIMAPVTVAMSNRFEPFPRGPAGPPPRSKVEYATGLVIDDLGHVVTDRQATEGCEVITLSGLGPAERVAAIGDLTLLRVYGARNLGSLSIAQDATTKGSEVMLVGIADPQAQGGKDSPIAVPARLNFVDGRAAIDPAPAPGFSGAAVLDNAGRLVGMTVRGGAVLAGTADSLAQARLVPLDQIRALLGSRNIVPRSDAASGTDAAKAAVVRVICVRK